MKLIYVANIKLPTDKAHGIQILKMCEAFALNGADVELIISKRGDALAAHDIFSFYNIKKRFKIKKIFCADFLNIKFLGKAAFALQYLSFALSVFFYALFNFKKFSKAEIIYCRDELSPKFLKIINKNIFLELHSFVKRFGYLKTIFLKGRGGLIVITKKAKENFIKAGVPGEKILIAPDAVDLSVFDINTKKEDARKKLNLPIDKKIFGYTGKFKTMGMDKGINDILKSMAMIDENIIFVAVGGSGKDISYYTKKAKELNVMDRTFFIKHVSQADLAVYQKACDILLMPFPYNQHYAYYMSPLKMFEYMASKRPIIATDLPSAREILSEKNAVLIKPDSPEDLARGIKCVLDDNELADKISSRAFQDVQRFTWDQRAEKIINFIKGKITE